MSTLFFILLLEILTLMLCVLLTSGDLLSPEFGFIACFIPGTLYAFFWAKRWSLDPALMTVAVYAGGFFTFLLVSILLQRKKSPARLQCSGSTSGGMIHVEPWKMVVIGFLQLIIIVVTARYLIGKYGTDLSSAMFMFRNASKFEEETMPSLLRMFRRVCLAAGHVTGYLFVLGVVTKEKRGSFFYLGSTILSLINGLMLGARGDSVQMIFGFIMDYLLLQRMISGGKKINIRKLMKITGLVLLMALSFAQVGELLGRGMGRFKVPEYIAIYMSAEIKNLDIYIRQGRFGTELLGSHVLHNILERFTDKAYTVRTPFYFVNGYDLGNVNTVFAPFLNDMGYFGVIFYTAIMAAIAQMLYRAATKPKAKKTIYISVILYSYVWSCLVFSFFSDKFFEYLTSYTSLWMLLSWLVLRWFLCDVKLFWSGKSST